MKTNLTELELIELAKKAKPVPVQPDVPRKPGSVAYKFTSVSEFVNATGLTSGKNEVHVKPIYEAYEAWAKDPMGLKSFGKDISKLLNKVSDVNYKINMKPITLMEKVKELKQHEEDKT